MAAAKRHAARVAGASARARSRRRVLDAVMACATLCAAPLRGQAALTSPDHEGLMLGAELSPEEVRRTAMNALWTFPSILFSSFVVAWGAECAVLHLAGPGPGAAGVDPGAARVRGRGGDRMAPGRATDDRELHGRIAAPDRPRLAHDLGGLCVLAPGARRARLLARDPARAGARGRSRGTHADVTLLHVDRVEGHAGPVGRGHPGEHLRHVPRHPPAHPTQGTRGARRRRRGAARGDEPALTRPRTRGDRTVRRGRRDALPHLVPVPHEHGLEQYQPVDGPGGDDPGGLLDVAGPPGRDPARGASDRGGAHAAAGRTGRGASGELQFPGVRGAGLLRFWCVQFVVPDSRTIMCYAYGGWLALELVSVFWRPGRLRAFLVLSRLWRTHGQAG